MSPQADVSAGGAARAVWLGVSALLALHVALALSAVAHKSVTADEILHVTGGYTYWKFGDYRIQPENGVLPQRVAGLPAWLGGAPPPPLADNLYWRTSDASVVGHQFFYETGHDHWPMLMASRATIMIFAVGTGLLIFCWSRSLFGTAGAFLSLGLYALCPNFLAHNVLTTSDSAAVFFLLATSGAFWRHLREPNLRTGALSAVTFGFVCVAKVSGVLVLPVMLLLLGWRIARDEPAARRRWLKLAPLSLAGHAVVAWITIWMFYGFRYSAFAPDVPAADHFIAPWARVLPYIGWHSRVVQFCREWKLLPEAYLYGYAWIIQSSQARGAFLAGDLGIYGWTSFFPLAFMWKTPLAVLAALAAGAVALARRCLSAPAQIMSELTRVAPLLALFLVYGAAAITSHLNIGHRHILPLYPVLFILLGGLAAPGAWPRPVRLALPAALLLGQAAASLGIYPHYLAYFNELAGGPANGHRLLVDSSLDWGQDLPGLTEWLHAHNRGPGAQPVYLSYFGSGEPDYYGIKAARLPFVNGFKLPHPWYQPGPGIYCVSATMLQQVYSPVQGAWTPEREKEYQGLRPLDSAFRSYWRDPAARTELLRAASAEQWRRGWERFDQLRFARLCHYLRARRPDVMIGYSIFIYRLTAGEVQAAMNGPYSAWLNAIERAQDG